MVVLLVFGSLARWVIAPPLVQHQLNDASLAFGEVTLADPSEQVQVSGTEKGGGGGSHYTVGISTMATVSDMPPIDATVEPFYLTMSYQGEAIGRVLAPAIRTYGARVINFKLEQRMDISSQGAFTAFSRALLEEKKVTTTVVGEATIKWNGFLPVAMGGLRFEKEVSLVGMNGLRHVTMSNFQVGLPNGAKGPPQATMTVDIYNPSQVSIAPLGSLSTVLRYQGQVLSQVEIPNVNAHEGHNPIPLSADFTPIGEAALKATGTAMSRYLQGDPVNMVATVENTTDASGVAHPADSIALYSASLRGVTFNALLWGPVRPLVQACVMQVDILKIIAALLKYGKVSIPADLAILNPFNATMRVTEIDLNVMYRNHSIALSDPHRVINKFNPVIIPPNPGGGDVFVATAVAIQFVIGVGTKELPALLAAMLAELKQGVSRVGTQGMIQATVGNIDVPLPYNQIEDIPVCPNWNTTSCRMQGKPTLMPYNKTTGRPMPQ